MNLSRFFSRTALGVASLVVLASAPTFAQDALSGARRGARGPAATAPAGGRPGAASPSERFERRVQHMIGRLGLDDAQAAQVRRIMEEGRAQHEALAGERLTGEQAMARRRAIMEANGQRIRAILRPDQQRVFDFHASRMREMGDRMREGGGRGRMGERARGHIRAMLGALGLDDAQRAAVRQIMEEGRAQHEALRSQALTRDERMARHRALMEANGQRIRALLRPDQQQVFDQQRAQMRQRFEAHRGGPGAGRAPTAPAPAGGI